MVMFSLSCSNDSSTLQDLPIAMGNVDCSSSSPRRLQDCTFTRNPGTCTNVGLECSSCSLYLCSDGQCVNAVACNDKRECNDGSDEDNIVCGELNVADYFFVSAPECRVKSGYVRPQKHAQKQRGQNCKPKPHTLKL